MARGCSKFELTIRPEHMNPHGVVHGGAIYTLADFAMGGALTSLLYDGGQGLVALATGSFYIQGRSSAASLGWCQISTRSSRRPARITVMTAVSPDFNLGTAWRRFTISITEMPGILRNIATDDQGPLPEDRLHEFTPKAELLGRRVLGLTRHARHP